MADNKIYKVEFEGATIYLEGYELMMDFIKTHNNAVVIMW